MLRLMLDGHPDIACCHERDFMLDHLEPTPTGWRLNKKNLQEDWIFRINELSVPESTDGAEAFADLCAQDTARSSKKIHILVVHRHVDRLLDLRPDIPIIHMLRDPRDVARSSIGMGWAGNTWYGADHWIETETKWKEQTHRMARDQVFDLQYEGLLEAPEDRLQALCNFLGLDYTPQMLDYSERSTYKPVDPSLAYQWKRKQTPREVAELDHKLHDLLTSSGYAPGPLPASAPGSWRRAQLGFENKRHIWKIMIQRYGVMDPLLLRIGRRLGLDGMKHAAKRRIAHKRQAHLK
jgi:hypothetical protein